jgi:hypothetical protein
MKINKKYLVLALSSFGLMAGFQNCSPIKASDVGASVVAAAQDGGGDGSVQDGGGSSNGSGGGGSSNVDLPSPPTSVAEAQAMCADAQAGGVKLAGNVGSQNGGSQMYQVISMSQAGSLNSGVRVFYGLAGAPAVDLIGSSNSSYLVICNLEVKKLGSQNNSIVVLVNSKIDNLGSQNTAKIYYDANTILGNIGSSNASMFLLK